MLISSGKNRPQLIQTPNHAINPSFVIISNFKNNCTTPSLFNLPSPLSHNSLSYQVQITRFLNSAPKQKQLIKTYDLRMGSRFEVEVTIESAKNLKNVNWRNGELKPYAVVWIDDGPKVTTKVDVDNGEDPIWDEKLVVPLPPSSRLEDAKLHIDVVHANAGEGVKPLVGSAKLHLHEVVDDVGIGGKAIKNLQLKRPSGRPHGKIQVKVAVKEPRRYYDQSAPPYGQATSRGYGEQYGGYGQPYAPPQSGGYGQPYAPPQSGGYGQSYAPPQSGYGYAAPPAGYPYGGPPQPAYGSSQYGASQPAYGSGSYDSYGSGAYGTAPVQQEQKKKLGMGAGLAIGAVGGVLGGLALAEGIDYVEDKIADDAADKVEDDLAYDDDGGDW